MANESWTTRRLRTWVRGFLVEKGVESAAACTDLLLGHVAECDRMHLYMEPDRPWMADELAQLRALVARAGQHEPVQYLVGTWGFHAADFEVGPATLIPRPSTESLVDAALEWIASQPDGSVRAAIDLGTGTGCIALSILRALRGRARKSQVLAHAHRSDGAEADAAALDADGQERSIPAAAPGSGVDLPAWVLTDLVPEALALAKRNAARHGLDERCSFRGGDAWDALEPGDGPFDLVASNPPYISDAEFALLAPNVARWEPRTALHGGASGLDVLERIVRGARRHMRPGALLLIEIAASQERAALDLATHAGFAGASVLKDSDGLPRVLRATAV